MRSAACALAMPASRRPASACRMASCTWARNSKAGRRLARRRLGQEGQRGLRLIGPWPPRATCCAFSKARATRAALPCGCAGGQSRSACCTRGQRLLLAKLQETAALQAQQLQPFEAVGLGARQQGGQPLHIGRRAGALPPRSTTSSAGQELAAVRRTGRKALSCSERQQQHQQQERQQPQRGTAAQGATDARPDRQAHRCPRCPCSSSKPLWSRTRGPLQADAGPALRRSIAAKPVHRRGARRMPELRAPSAADAGAARP